jgi:hypothetical protein
MGPNEEVFDSPKGWVRDHIKGYVESNGKVGHLWRGVHTLLLTTRGRKTGKSRTALIYGQDGKNFPTLLPTAARQYIPIGTRTWF